MLYLQLIVSTISAFLLLVFNESTFILWIGTAFYGFGMSAIFPTVFGLAEEYIDVSGRISSALVIGAAFGEMLLPLTIGNKTTEEHPISFIVVIFVIAVATSVFSLCLVYAG
jgi:FHS family Na+ dependent glucose MFS transporter 1